MHWQKVLDCLFTEAMESKNSNGKEFVEDVTIVDVSVSSSSSSFLFFQEFFSKKETKTTEKTFVCIMICRHLGGRGAISNIEIGRSKKKCITFYEVTMFFRECTGLAFNTFLTNTKDLVFVFIFF